MSTKRMLFALVVALVIATVTPLHAQEKAANAAPSITKGDPPPGNAMALSVPQARAMLKAAIQKRYVGTMKSSYRNYRRSWYTNFVLSEATNVHVRLTGFAFTAPSRADDNVGSRDGRVSVNFLDPAGKVREGFRLPAPVKGYLEVYRADLVESAYFGRQGVAGDTVVFPKPLYSVGYLPKPERATILQHETFTVFAWTDGVAAQEFADAFNHLLYAAYRNEEDSGFITAAKAWRENPAKPPLSAESERHRILAENAIKEKNLDSAVEHYESALEVQPMWPAGWFNLAIIYAEQNNYVNATDRMKHYLELAPDAPDAKDARTQMIIWEDKAKH